MKFSCGVGRDSHHFESNNYVGKKVSHIGVETSFGLGKITKQYWNLENEGKSDWSARLEVTFDSGEVHIFTAMSILDNSTAFRLKVID